jgi:Fe-S-cluster-containing dehydrogenase component/formate-dependent nitrite reductase membrane component NrfD
MAVGFSPTEPGGASRFAKVIDQTKCIGCHACTTACRSENDVPLSVNRTFVKAVEVGVFPQVRRNFQVTRCNQCEDAPCVAACPTTAMFRRPDGIVDFDKSACIGCKACMAACPYDAIFINPEDHSAEKCNFCAHRLDIGLEPACVVVCPVEAILVGDLEDPGSKVAELVQREPVTVRRPEKETRPKLFYRGAGQATLDPLAARRPDGGLFMWSEQGAVAHQVPSGHPGPWNSSAAALLAYDVPHRAPWDWRVSLYTWTKGIAAGVYLVALSLALAGLLSWSSSLLRWATPSLALGFLAATGAILIADLEHPLRFHFIFLRPQWRSWLVRGAFVIAGYAAVLAVGLLAAAVGSTWVVKWLAAPGIPLAALAAVYTAFLFAQAKARDLWQSPLLPPQLLVQAGLAGSAILLPFSRWLGGAGTPLRWVLAATALAQLVIVASELWTGHSTAHAHLALREMTRGRFASFFWIGVAGVAVALAAPWIGLVAVPFALVGLLAHEHAYVQAGQAVPLA